jgi:hypothetical protein
LVLFHTHLALLSVGRFASDLAFKLSGRKPQVSVH